MKPTERRKCPDCGMTFKAMTDAQWKYVLMEHVKLSVKHRERITAKKRSTS